MGIFSGVEDKFIEEEIDSLKDRFKKGMRKGHDFTKGLGTNQVNTWLSQLKDAIKYLKKNERERDPHYLGFVVGAIFCIFDKKYDAFLATILSNESHTRIFRLILRELVPKEGLSMNIVKKRLERTNNRAQEYKTRTLHSDHKKQQERQAYIVLQKKLPDFIHSL